jgi:hypothetical protein
MIIEKTNSAITVQVHYCFNDDTTYSMNAEIFNECERQFIKAIRRIEKYLDKTLSIEIKSRESGSIVDVFSIAINSDPAILTIGTLIGILIKTFFDSRIPPALPKAEEVSKKLENIIKIKEEIKNGTLTETELDYIINNDKELRKLRSEFFKSVKKESKVAKLEAKTLPNLILPPIVIVVDRENFDSFILPKKKKKMEDTEQTKVYIVSPILIKGRKDLWKGICENSNIDFKITDKEFLEQVWNQSIRFGNGTFINCDLKTVKTTNTETEKPSFAREVVNVINYGDDDKQVKKISHRKKDKKDDILQLNLFNDV